MQKQNEALKEETTQEQIALDVALAKIQEDAKRDPAKYLQETIVPEGGE